MGKVVTGILKMGGRQLFWGGGKHYVSLFLLIHVSEMAGQRGFSSSQDGSTSEFSLRVKKPQRAGGVVLSLFVRHLGDSFKVKPRSMAGTQNLEVAKLMILEPLQHRYFAALQFLN